MPVAIACGAVVDDAVLPGRGIAGNIPDAACDQPALGAASKAHGPVAVSTSLSKLAPSRWTTSKVGAAAAEWFIGQRQKTAPRPGRYVADQRWPSSDRHRRARHTHPAQLRVGRGRRPSVTGRPSRIASARIRTVCMRRTDSHRPNNVL